MIRLAVSSVSPVMMGRSDCVMDSTARDPSPGRLKMFSEMIPLRRFAMKREIADLALFLCSDAAQFITGAVMVCDGGQSLATQRSDILTDATAKARR